MIAKITKVLKEYIVGPFKETNMINSFSSTLKIEMGPFLRSKYLMKLFLNNCFLDVS
jgi:hypothetical protein